MPSETDSMTSLPPDLAAFADALLEARLNRRPA